MSWDICSFKSKLVSSPQESSLTLVTSAAGLSRSRQTFNDICATSTARSASSRWTLHKNKFWEAKTNSLNKKYMQNKCLTLTSVWSLRGCLQQESKPWTTHGEAQNHQLSVESLYLFSDLNVTPYLWSQILVNKDWTIVMAKHTNK